jgi:hypothetical protein
MSSKMNEIYPARMAELSGYCSRGFSAKEMTMLEGWVLAVFGFDLSFPEIAYTILAQLLAPGELARGELLLGLAVAERKIMAEGEETVAMAVTSLIKPEIMKHCQNGQKVKATAVAIRNLFMGRFGEEKGE